ncbi:putative myosin x [Operophtera brumata]|uniref:Putative myosin x n=1 Tax=Operophtera brumata TaxID=104452 RepID=A0A0L7LV62_OPEBR|nr:putative myosin x [Operophtera brumata]
MVGPIVVAVNPYTDTCNALTLTEARAQRPELARLVSDAVRHQADTGYPQAIILSGVSGSGKTYASMVLLRRLFDVAGGGPETDAFKHLAAAFTVLRALGTAATPANSSSSRIVSTYLPIPSPCCARSAPPPRLPTAALAGS